MILFRVSDVSYLSATFSLMIEILIFHSSEKKRNPPSTSKQQAKCLSLHCLLILLACKTFFFWLLGKNFQEVYGDNNWSNAGRNPRPISAAPPTLFSIFIQ